MNAKITLDKAGRIVLPKPLRDELQLEAGDTLEAESSGEEITLRPARDQAQIRKKQGIWVFRAGEPLSESTVRKTQRQIQRERETQSTGNKK